MTIGGLQKVSLIDYPGKISAIVFMQGCNFRCAYCYNQELVYPHLFKEPIPENEVLSFLDNRKGLLDGVVVTGGEPLLQSDLEDFLREVKAMGYQIKLDTNGSMPDRLEGLIREGLVDYMAMDYKAPISRYPVVTGVESDKERIPRSIEVITGSGLSYEMRTTVFSGLGMRDLLEMMTELQTMNVESYFLQVFKPFFGCSKDLSPGYPDIEYLQENLAGSFLRYGIKNMKQGSLVESPRH
ncbi:MAG TPA: anaerobic ribonucleoside-triphosphate reductase activating protein [Nitrospirae bacterium]|nr:anaerobic ribonucleoside-triphosphate reductase activating protein [Nitrospirota bacterium]